MKYLVREYNPNMDIGDRVYIYTEFPCNTYQEAQEFIQELKTIDVENRGCATYEIIEVEND